MPGLKGALSIRVNDGQTDRIVTQHCSNLKFTKVAPGGHHSLSFTMVLPRNTFNNLGPQDRVYVYDARTAKTVIEGYLENPTPIDGPEGQQYDISAMGGMALLNDETRALIYATHDITGWNATPNASASATVDVGDWDSDYNPATPPTPPTLQRVRTAFAGGSVLATGTVAQAVYAPFEASDMEIGGYQIGSLLSGKTDANYTLDILSSLGTVVSVAMQTIPVASSVYLAAGVKRLAVQLRRSGGATNVADDETWTDWVDWSAIGRRLDRNGTPITGASLGPVTSVLAFQVVEDLLGRLLTFCDPATAQIDTTTHAIDQIAYPDGTKAGGVLNDLAEYETEFLHEILETLDNGLHRFNYRAWPTTRRYEVSVKDGWRQTGSDADLCNRILVSWVDAAGNTQTLPVTAADLGLAGIGLPIDDLGSRVKDADPITLPASHGSAAAALRIGGQILRDKIAPPLAGTVLVRRRIKDLLTGNYVDPHELEAGYLCGVRELGTDLPVTKAEYDDPSTSMLLTLGRPLPTPDQRLARLDTPAASAGVLNLR